MSLLPLQTCPPVISLPSTWEQETLDLYVAFRESNNPISIPVASAFDTIVKLAKAGGGGEIEYLTTEDGDTLMTEDGQSLVI